MLSLRFSLPLSSNTTLTYKNQCNLRSSTNCGTNFPKILATTSSTYKVVDGKEVVLPESLKRELMPKHVAVIMDGNGRWARQKGMMVGEGHRAGVEKIKVLIRLCLQWGIKVLTLFAFSTENWTRPKDEVDFLMKMFLELSSSQDNVGELLRDGVRVSFIGDKSKLSRQLRETFNLVEEKSKSNSGLHLMVALNYSGQHDILQATKNIASKVKNGVIEIEDIDKSLFEQELETSHAEFPNPDLFIRTSGEQRVSNFLLWQLAYTELYFANKMLPDMEEGDFIEALNSFQQRQRRYGGRKI